MQIRETDLSMSKQQQQKNNDLNKKKVRKEPFKLVLQYVD